MTDLNLNTAILIGVIMASMSSIIAFLLVQFTRKRERRYDTENNRAQLEMLRENYEGKMYQLVDRLLASEERWKDVNHLLVSAQKQQGNGTEKTTHVHLTDFLKSNGVSEKDLEIDKELVVVLTPFHAEYEKVFKTIREVCDTVGLKCLRGDEEHVTGDILTHILQIIVRARIVIANIDGRNANVFYELGITHTIDKRTILISSSLDELPFDLKGKRMIVYKSFTDLQKQLRNELAKVLVKT